MKFLIVQTNFGQGRHSSASYHVGGYVNLNFILDPQHGRINPNSVSCHGPVQMQLDR